MPISTNTQVYGANTLLAGLDMENNSATRTIETLSVQFNKVWLQTWSAPFAQFTNLLCVLILFAIENEVTTWSFQLSNFANHQKNGMKLFHCLWKTSTSCIANEHFIYPSSTSVVQKSLPRLLFNQLPQHISRPFLVTPGPWMSCFRLT